MQIDNWEEVSRLFDAALELDPVGRREFVQRTASSGAVADQVLRLIAAADRETGFLATGAGGLAQGHDFLSKGDRVGNWEIDEKLGHGGMGEVYQAHRADGHYLQRGALKLIRTGDDAAWERFSRERQILADLEHPFIARLIDGGVAGDGRPFLVMELVDGQPIDVWLTGRVLSRDAIVRLFLDACEGVAHAHSRLVLHRDIKPANILVTEDAKIRLVDFGVAGLLSDSPDDLNAPMTLAYAAPEQIFGRTVSASTDVFGLAATLCELLTGVPPDRTPERMRFDRTPLGKPMASVLEKALSLSPEARYSTVDAFASDLRNSLEHLPLSHQQGSASVALSSFIKRNPVVMGVASLGVVAILGWAVTAQTFSARYERERDKARVEEARAVRIKDAFVDIFRRSNPNEIDTLVAPEDNESAWSYLAQASEAAMTGLSAEPEVALPLLYWTIDLYGREGDYEKLGQALDRYQALSREAYGPDSEVAVQADAFAFREWAFVSRKRPVVLEERDFAAEGRTLLERLNAMPDMRADTKAAVLQFLVGGYGVLGDWEKATELSLKVLALPDLPDTDQNRAYRVAAATYLVESVKAQGDFEGSLKYARQALSIAETGVPADHFSLVTPLVRLAGILDELGQPEEALIYADRALAIQKNVVGENAFQLDEIRNTLANIHASLGNFAEAMENYEGNLRALEAKGLTESFDYSTTWQNLGIMREKAGDLVGAIEASERAFEIRAKVTADEEPQRYYPLVSLARVHLRHGDLKQSAEYSERARRSLRGLIPDTHFVFGLLDCYEGEALVSTDPKRAQGLLTIGLQVMQDVQGREGEVDACRAALTGLE